MTSNSAKKWDRSFQILVRSVWRSAYSRFFPFLSFSCIQFIPRDLRFQLQLVQSMQLLYQLVHCFSHFKPEQKDAFSDGFSWGVCYFFTLQPPVIHAFSFSKLSHSSQLKKYFLSSFIPNNGPTFWLLRIDVCRDGCRYRIAKDFDFLRHSIPFPKGKEDVNEKRQSTKSVHLPKVYLLL